jgi:hypothetical protein
MGTWDAEPLVLGRVSSADFQEISDWHDSPEGQLFFKVQAIVERQLKKADVDAQNRKIVWKDGQRLSIAESAQRIHQKHPKVPLNAIESQIANWLVCEFVPSNYTQEELDEFERLTGEWADEHERKMLADEEQRTRHS